MTPRNPWNPALTTCSRGLRSKKKFPSFTLIPNSPPPRYHAWAFHAGGCRLKVNGEAIYATRPWKIYGEGPSTQMAEKGQFDGQKDVSDKQFTAEDIRFTQSKNGKTVYAIVLEIPKDGQATIKSLATSSVNWPGKIGSVRLVGGGKLKFTRDENGLHVSCRGSLMAIRPSH